jgi:crotonobetainyl-CoA:carnitine CoA-transferase CaiB-like acyl-CoA transferase
MLPAAAPRLSESGARAPQPGPHPGEHTDAVLRELGLNATR